MLVVSLVACDSTSPIQPIESSKLIATQEGACPFDIVGQWEGESQFTDWWRGHIVQFCEDGTWTNIYGFSGTWNLDGNVLAIANRRANSTGFIFIARFETSERLYLNVDVDQLMELEALFLGSARDEHLYQRYRISFRKISD